MCKVKRLINLFPAARSFNHTCLHRLASWLELGSQLGLDYWSLIWLLPYPTHQRSKHKEGWASYSCQMILTENACILVKWLWQLLIGRLSNLERDLDWTDDSIRLSAPFISNLATVSRVVVVVVVGFCRRGFVVGSREFPASLQCKTQTMTWSKFLT